MSNTQQVLKSAPGPERNLQRRSLDQSSGSIHFPLAGPVLNYRLVVEVGNPTEISDQYFGHFGLIKSKRQAFHFSWGKMSGKQFSIPDAFTIDVHTHPIPDFYRDALVKGGYPNKDGHDLRVDGFVVPPWTLQSYLRNRDQFNYDFSIMSISAPGVSFLTETSDMRKLARKLNDQMAEWTKSNPTRLGAFGILPAPDIEGSLEEISYCLDVLKLDGIGLYTNYRGIYLGDPSLDPIMEELSKRKAVCLVHPVAPYPEPNLIDISAPAIEYTFDSTRAVTNLIFKGTSLNFPDVKLIFSHGGGTVPFLADRIAGQSSLPFQGGKDRNESFKQMTKYYYDLAAATSPAQIAALRAFVDIRQLLAGSDAPYFPDAFIPLAQKSLYSHPDLSADDLKKIRHGNALELFPHILEKLKRADNSL